MLAVKIDPDPVEVPNEPGNTFHFRPLSGDDLDDAEAAAMREMASALGRDAAAVFGEMQSDAAQAAATKQREAAKESGDADPLDGYSRKVLLRGLARWEGENYAGIKCDDKGKAELMEPARSWAALQVLNRSKVSEGKARSSEIGTKAA